MKSLVAVFILFAFQSGLVPTAAKAAEETPLARQNPEAVAKSTVLYTGAAANQRLQVVSSLSDGTVLIGGGADNLDWVPADVPRIPLSGDSIREPVGGTRIAFILRASGDLKRVLQVLHFPPGVAEGIKRIRTTSEPGRPTGDIYLSGATRETKGSGYFIARLNGNFVDKAPSGCVWVRNVWGGGWYRETQPWDVGGDGKVVFAEGVPFSYDWSAIARLKNDGRDDVVEDWRTHEGKAADGGNASGHWTPASSRKDVTPGRSIISLKFWGRADLRSWTQADYDTYLPDGNGGFKKGRWPLDGFFAGPGDPAQPDKSPGGPGYTGYRRGASATMRVGDIAVDRRHNHFYFGLSIQSKLPSGEPDFEPAVVAMTHTGQLKWWSRLYHEFLDKNGNGQFDAGEPANSSPDQYVDYLAIDYSKAAQSGDLVVLARCHGNNVINLWNGDKIAARPGAKGFKHGFSGSGGNFHLSWLGKLGLDDGTLHAASYLAEMADDMAGAGSPSGDPLLDGWPDPNAGWPVLNTTRAKDLTVDNRGCVYVLATGRRVVTTANAFQKMPKKAEGVSSWSDFVRVYTPDLGRVVYSSILSGPWHPATGQGGGNVALGAVSPWKDGVLIAGDAAAYTREDIAKSKQPDRQGRLNTLPDSLLGMAKGHAMPTANVPAWGTAQPKGATGILGYLWFGADVPESSKR
jgi:hypothetical protein